MMSKIEKAETILKNMLEIYNYEMGYNYTFEKISVDDDFCSCYAFGSVAETPFLYFTVYISNITDYFSVEIFERTGFRDDDYDRFFMYTNV